MINGELTTLHTQTLSFRPFEGGELGGTYEGEKNAVYALVQPLINAGYQVSYETSQSLIAKLTFRCTFQSTHGGPATNPNVDFKDTWELIRNSVHKELLESDHPYVSALNETNMNELKKYFTNPSKVEDGIAQFEVVSPADNPSPSINSVDAATYLWALFVSGVKTVEVKQPIIRLTRTTNALYDAPFYTGNIDTVLTTASMQFDSGLPSNFAIPAIDLASALMKRSGNLQKQARTDGLDLQFGWLKELVGCNKHGNQRIQYVLEYKFGLFDTKLNGVPS